MIDWKDAGKVLATLYLTMKFEHAFLHVFAWITKLKQINSNDSFFKKVDGASICPKLKMSFPIINIFFKISCQTVLWQITHFIFQCKYVYIKQMIFL